MAVYLALGVTASLALIGWLVTAQARRQGARRENDAEGADNLLVAMGDAHATQP